MKRNRKLRIFIVEDNLIYQQLIAKQLESISYAIHFFTKGEDCIENIPQSNPDLIVLDNDLDGSFSGLDTLKLIRILYTDLYVIIFSTQALNTAENLSYYGTFEFVEKNDRAFSCLKEKICTSKVFLQKIKSEGAL